MDLGHRIEVAKEPWLQTASVGPAPDAAAASSSDAPALTVAAAASSSDAPGTPPQLPPPPQSTVKRSRDTRMARAFDKYSVTLHPELKERLGFIGTALGNAQVKVNLYRKIAWASCLVPG